MSIHCIYIAVAYGLYEYLYICEVGLKISSDRWIIAVIFLDHHLLILSAKFTLRHFFLTPHRDIVRKAMGKDIFSANRSRTWNMGIG